MGNRGKQVRGTLRLGTGWLANLFRFSGLFGLAFVAFAIVLLIFGKNPIRAYGDIFSSTLGSAYGFSEVLVKMIPLTLCAVAVALPARIWLINVGGEGQLYLGALFATWGALTFPHLPAWLLLPLISALGFLGGGLWALISGVLRARGWVSETISTLLMNYVAILLLNFFVFGPWKDPESANYPQSAPFPDAAILPSFWGTRVHLGRFLRWPFWFSSTSSFPARGGDWRCGPSGSTRKRPGATASPSSGILSSSCSSGVGWPGWPG